MHIKAPFPMPAGWPLDTSNPLLRGAMCVATFNEGAGNPRNWLDGSAATISGVGSSFSRSGTAYGPGIKLVARTTVGFNGSPTATATGPLTMVFLGSFDRTQIGNEDGRLVSTTDSESGVGGITLIYTPNQTGGVGWGALKNNVAWLPATGASLTPTVGGLVAAAIVFNPDLTIRVYAYDYVQGKFTTGANSNTQSLQSGGSGRWGCNQERAIGFASTFTPTYNMVLCLRTIWTEQDFRSFVEQPQQIYGGMPEAFFFSPSIPEAGSSGSGAVSLGGFSISGSGLFTSGASGSPTLSAMSTSGSGRLTASSTGSVTLAGLSVSGAGKLTTSAAGSVALAAMTVAGSSSSLSTGTGSVVMAAISVSGSGTALPPASTTGSGAIVLGPMTTLGVGITNTGENLGRFRHGDTVDVSVSLPSIPDSPPLATLYGPTGQPVTSYYMPTRDGLEFSVSPTVGAWALGTFSVSIAYSISGVPSSLVVLFDVVPGGDSGGSIISMHVHSRPESNYVVAQLSSGVVVQGRNPHL